MAARHSPESPLQTVHERNFALRASECGRYSMADRFGGRGLDDCPACWACRVVLVLLVVLAATALAAAAGPGVAPPATYADCLVPPFFNGRICLSPGPAWMEWALWIEIGAISLFGLICAICCAFPRPRTREPHRPIDPGSEELRIEIGDEGLRLRGHRREIRLGWSAFDAHALFEQDSYLGQPRWHDPTIDAHPGTPVRLDDLLNDLHGAPPHSALGRLRDSMRNRYGAGRPQPQRRIPAEQQQAIVEGLQREIAEAASRGDTESIGELRLRLEDAQAGYYPKEEAPSQGNKSILLPLRRDAAAERRTPARERQMQREGLSRLTWNEYITIPRRFFEGASSQIDWPDFVAACAWMIRLANPKRGEQ
ncbi:hypothetical protein DDZ18_10710 [Marinicauda salina]|uniref:Uncharacterized protein n=1 Tax=Marinicauda salina TaxID=2135793 RepID=A0A2U2BRM9_9PROT|nr:hypothetical protein [Marinicauda salina]PWE16673.1 hypothetical protein DDZ18_10710 [Marinicauda salina]